MKDSLRLISWLVQLGIAVILVQTLYFKFSAHPESVAVFTELGMEPYGRIGIGAVELVTAVLLLLPGRAVWGALLTLGLMSGAILSHITTLGWQGDRASLGILAVLCWFGAAVITGLRYREIPFPGLVQTRNRK